MHIQIRIQFSNDRCCDQFEQCATFLLRLNSITLQMNVWDDSADNADLFEALHEHSGDLNIAFTSWTIKKDGNGRRGIFATHDIEVNEIIFHDRPLLIGPIVSASDRFICVACYRHVDPKASCAMHCGFPICNNCPKRNAHLRECSLTRSWSPKCTTSKSLNAINGLSCIRALLLSDEKKHLLQLLQSNHSIEDKFVMHLSKEYTEFPTDADTIGSLKLATAVRNTNAFKLLLSSERNNNISVSGIYPLMVLMNHNCVPNVRHTVNDQLIGKVAAVRKVAKGEQLFVSYSQLLWNTPTRQAHMAVTKQFRCMCDRCRDPTEFSTVLSALNCPTSACSGYALPVNPLALTSRWQCFKCANELSCAAVLNMQSVLTAILKQYNEADHTPITIIRFIQQRLSRMIPLSNQYVIELKLTVIWRLECDGKFLQYLDLTALHF